MKLEEKIIWPFKTKITEKRNYDRKDLAFSFQSQITVHARTSWRGEQFRLAGDNRELRSLVFHSLHRRYNSNDEKVFCSPDGWMHPFYFPLFFDRESFLIMKVVVFLVLLRTECEPVQERQASVSVPRE